MPEITGLYNSRASWEKQSVWNLDNGFQVIVEYNSHYGDFCSRINAPTSQKRKMVWHCSNGLADLPEWAQPWIEVVNQAAQTKLVRPGFTKRYAKRKAKA